MRCATSAGSPTAGSTRCRTARCWPPRWCPYLAGGHGLEHNFPVPNVLAPTVFLTIDDLLVGYETVVPHFVNAIRPIEWRYTNDRPGDAGQGDGLTATGSG